MWNRWGFPVKFGLEQERIGSEPVARDEKTKVGKHQHLLAMKGVSVGDYRRDVSMSIIDSKWAGREVLAY